MCHWRWVSELGERAGGSLVLIHVRKTVLWMWLWLLLLLLLWRGRSWWWRSGMLLGSQVGAYSSHVRSRRWTRRYTLRLRSAMAWRKRDRVV